MVSWTSAVFASLGHIHPYSAFHHSLLPYVDFSSISLRPSSLNGLIFHRTKPQEGYGIPVWALGMSTPWPRKKECLAQTITERFNSIAFSGTLGIKNHIFC